MDHRVRSKIKCQSCLLLFHSKGCQRFNSNRQSSAPNLLVVFIKYLLLSWFCVALIFRLHISPKTSRLTDVTRIGIRVVSRKLISVFLLRQTHAKLKQLQLSSTLLKILFWNKTFWSVTRHFYVSCFRVVARYYVSLSTIRFQFQTPEVVRLSS